MIQGTWFDSLFEDKTEHKKEEEEEDKQAEDTVSTVADSGESTPEEVLYGEDISRVYQLWSTEVRRQEE